MAFGFIHPRYAETRALLIAPACVVIGALLTPFQGAGYAAPGGEQVRTGLNNWIKTGSHVMIVGAEAKSMMQGYPRDPNADPTKPYVMWPGTPYEHLMLPVK